MPPPQKNMPLIIIVVLAMPVHPTSALPHLFHFCLPFHLLCSSHVWHITALFYLPSSHLRLFFCLSVLHFSICINFHYLFQLSTLVHCFVTCRRDGSSVVVYAIFTLSFSVYLRCVSCPAVSCRLHPAFLHRRVKCLNSSWRCISSPWLDSHAVIVTIITKWV